MFLYPDECLTESARRLSEHLLAVGHRPPLADLDLPTVLVLDVPADPRDSAEDSA